MRIDFDRFLHSVVDVKNENGSRAYETGLRTFDCPLCGDLRGRGWLGVTRFAAGCFNPGCVAETQLAGGVVEWARLVLDLPTRAETWRALTREYGTDAPAALAPPPPRSEDWCRLPAQAHRFAPENPLASLVAPDPTRALSAQYERFVVRQWGIPATQIARWDLRWCASGRHARRVVIPVTMGGQVVAFQSRTIVSGAEPKYLTSAHGPESDPAAECGRPAGALLFNVDAVRPGDDPVLVEGAGDVMGWHRQEQLRPAVALLGVALTPAKLALISAARPARVVVALDAEPAAQARAQSHVADLLAWGVDAVLGVWVGAKDAGAGARLEVASRFRVADAVQAKLRARR